MHPPVGGSLDVGHRSLEGHSGSVEHIACSGNVIVSGGSDRYIDSVVLIISHEIDRTSSLVSLRFGIYMKDTSATHSVAILMKLRYVFVSC